MLLHKKCRPCESGEGALNALEIQNFLKETTGWGLADADKKIERIFEFKNFAEALKFANKVGEIAEDEGHHPDILIFSWNKVKVSSYTHSVGGLTENDFILATKISEI